MMGFSGIIFQSGETVMDMYRVLNKEKLAPNMKRIEVQAPEISKRARPGQFVIIRVSENGERIPLTVHSADPEAGTITLFFLEVGKTTKILGKVPQGGELQDVVGPLGVPSHIDDYGVCVAIGGGIGTACVYPVAEALKREGNTLISIIGAKTKDLVILEKEFRKISDELYITTDDGTYGRKGFVTDKLRDLIDSGQKVDYVYAVGPAIMMKAVAEVTRPHDIETTVSLNPIMVDGTGMCGGCRVEIGGETKFACVDGPEFDAHKVNFDLLLKRQRFYTQEEKCQLSDVE